MAAGDGTAASRGPLSEHSFGNALDVAGFRLASGREVTVLQGWWRGTPRDRAFLQLVFAGACAEFYTVLGPGSDAYHSNHFHLDLLRTNARGGRHFCQPQPRSGAYANLPGSEPAGRLGGQNATFFCRPPRAKRLKSPISVL